MSAVDRVFGVIKAGRDTACKCGVREVCKRCDADMLLTDTLPHLYLIVEMEVKIRDDQFKTVGECCDAFEKRDVALVGLETVCASWVEQNPADAVLKGG